MSLVDQIEAMIESGLSVKDALKAARVIEEPEFQIGSKPLFTESGEPILRYEMPIRPIIRNGGVGMVPLSQGKFAIVDAADIPLVEGRNWHAYVHLKVWYAANNEWVTGVGDRRIILHRLIAGAQPGQQVDHRNGDGLDCRRANLRIATPSQNSMNRGLRSDSRSGLKGANLKSNGRWGSSIAVDGKRRYLGVFDTAREAHEAYGAAAVEAHGEFARFK